MVCTAMYTICNITPTHISYGILVTLKQYCKTGIAHNVQNKFCITINCVQVRRVYGSYTRIPLSDAIRGTRRVYETEPFLNVWYADNKPKKITNKKSMFPISHIGTLWIL